MTGLTPGKRIAVVLGASGYMGSNLAPALAAHGWHVRAVARNAAVLEAREWEGVECRDPADRRVPHRA